MPGDRARKRLIIMGAAGRDFHNFNMLYRGRADYEVVAFTATQIPYITDRKYPPELAGSGYPEGIPIVEETELEALCTAHRVEGVVFSYSDIPLETVMHAASRAQAVGADFLLPGPHATMLSATKPVISVTAVRTGCGKSQTCRWLFERLRTQGVRAGVIRHPMPYGDLVRQAVQRFASVADMDAADCTNEEREEYAPYIEAGGVIYAGVDYQAILRKAEQEADVILWDGGNNDFSFIKPDLSIVLADALRPDQIATHYPGETAARMADVFVINKTQTAPAGDVDRLAAGLAALRPGAPVVRARSPIAADDPDMIDGRRVLVVEDGPTITHGGLPHGAGYLAAMRAGAGEIIDPRPFAAPEIAKTYAQYPHIGPVLPALGYSAVQLAALRDTIEQSGAEVVVVATPFDLAGHLHLQMPSVRVRYNYADGEAPSLGGLVDEFLAGKVPPRG